MKLTKIIQESIDTQSKEEAKAIAGETREKVEEAGTVLEDEELDEVAGGEFESWMKVYLFKCNKCGAEYKSLNLRSTHCNEPAQRIKRLS